jgi:hypothetical protein
LRDLAQDPIKKPAPESGAGFFTHDQLKTLIWRGFPAINPQAASFALS